MPRCFVSFKREDSAARAVKSMEFGVRQPGSSLILADGGNQFCLTLGQVGDRSVGVRESNWKRYSCRQRELMSKCMKVKMGRKSRAQSREISFQTLAVLQIRSGKS